MRWVCAWGAMMMMMHTACPSSAPVPTPVASADIGPPGGDWSALTPKAKGQYMKHTVVPRMKALFQGYDAETFDDFGCSTCHGDDAEERHFEMPNPDLLTLYPTGHPEQKKLVARLGGSPNSVLHFMFKKVVPTMTDLLNAPPYDDETKTGFSCFNCHPKGV